MNLIPAIHYCKVLVVFYLIFSSITLIAQSPEENLEKYWHYRERLVKQFMIGIGEKQGFSLPASQRSRNAEVLAYGDVTMNLGHYIGILALEYKLLEMNGEDTEETLKELFYAISAINRLDRFAEYHIAKRLGKISPESYADMNGFLIRDDVDPNYFDQEELTEIFDRLNEKNPKIKVKGFRSDLTAAEIKDMEMSKDQIIQLYIGLALVIKHVPTNVTYNNKSFPWTGTIKINEEAKNIVIRIVNYIGGGTKDWNWDVLNPVTGEKVDRGNNAYLLSAGFSGVKERLTGIKPSLNLIGETKKTSAIGTFISYATYPLIYDDPLTKEKDCQNEDDKALILAAVSQIWPDGTIPEGNEHVKFNSRKIGKRSLSENSLWPDVPSCKSDLIHLPLFHYALNGGEIVLGDIENPKSKYDDLLNEAPKDRIYNNGDGDYSSYEWSSTSRTLQPWRRALNAPEFAHFWQGEQNGVDYLLIYALYHYAYKD